MAKTVPGFRLLDFDETVPNLIAYELTGGEVTDDDLAPYWKRFDEVSEDRRALRIYAEMHEQPKFGDGLVLEKLKRFDRARSILERMAIVGDADWLGVYAKSAREVYDGEIRHFPMADREAARAWIREE